MNSPLPPLSWFEDPGLELLTPLTVTDDGRCYGHICGWGVRHRGLNGYVTPPRSKSGYANFLLHAVRVADGDEIRTVAVGNLTMGTNHAAMNLDLRQATDHYDRADSAVAQVTVGEDSVGVWFGGAVLPDVDELRLRRFMSCGLSGDWRADPKSGGLDLCAVLSCPVPGFPIPRARVASGAPMALVAAGALAPPRAAFAKRVDPAWATAATPTLSASDIVTGTFTSGSPGTRVKWAYGPADKITTMDELTDASAARLDARRAAGELSAAHTALVAELDDTPAVVAALLAEVDDSPHRMAALLAELDEAPEEFNWVEEAGGLPGYIKRISKHLEKKGMTESHAIATAVNAAKKMCASGDLNFPGVQEVNPGSRAEACAAVADWEAKKARAKAS